MFTPLRKLVCSFALVTAAVTHNAGASPAVPGYQDFLLDSGAYIKLAMKGDEYFNWYESMNGNIYVSHNGEIYFAAFDSNYNIVPSSYTINDFPDNDFQFLNIQNPTVVSSINAQSDAAQYSMSEPTAGILEDPSGTEGLFPPAPSANLLVVMISFSDVQITGSQSYWDDIFFGQTNQFYIDVSRGQFSYNRAAETQAPVNDGIVNVQLNRYHPNNGRGSSPSVLTDALEAADEYVDFAQFDTNNDGQLETEELNIYFVFAGNETASMGENQGPSVWAHVASLPTVSFDNVQLTMKYARQGEFHAVGRLATFGISAHELGHLTFNWPDLYDTSSSSDDGNNTLGRWCLMASGSWNTVYEISPYGGAVPAMPNPILRHRYGWEEEHISESVNQLIPTLSGGHALKVETNDTYSYSMIESKQSTSWDRSLNLNNPGMLVWKYRGNGSNAARIDWNGGGTLYPSITLASNVANEDGTAGYNLTANQIVWPSNTGNNSIGTQGDPNLHVSDGRDRSITHLQGWDITNISSNAQGVVSFNITKTTNFPPLVDLQAPTSGFPGAAIAFDASDSRDQDGEIVEYRFEGPWGSHLTTASTFDYTFSSTGIYEVTVVATDNEGASNSASVEVEIVDQNAPPVAILNGFTNSTINLADSITFTAFDSYDPKPNGGITSYYWTGPWGSQQGAPYFSYRFLTPGVFDITLQVTDTAGNTATDSVTITVYDDGVNLPPVASLPESITVTQANAYYFTTTDSYDEDGQIVEALWEGPWGTRTGNNFYWSFYDLGEFEVTLTVTDNEGASDTATTTVTVNERVFSRTYDNVYLRGTTNNWQTTQMELVYDYLWEIEAYFGSTANERFKFDIYGDWSLNYGDNENDRVAEQFGDDIFVTEGEGNYRIRFNDQTKVWWLEKIVEPVPPVANAGPDQIVEVGTEVQFDGSGSYDPDGSIVFYYWSNGLNGVNPTLVYDEIGTYTVELSVRDNSGYYSTDTMTVTVTDVDTSFDSIYPQANLRGTANNWISSAMTLVADYTWQITATFGDTSTERFKFDIYGDWGTNFGDTNGDGTLEQGGGDIAVTEGAGDYIITFNDQNLTYTVDKIVGPVAPVANAGSDVSIRPGETVTFNGSATGEAAIVSYLWTSPAWSGELTGQQPNFTFNSVGTFIVTLSVEDENGLTDDDTMVVTVTENQAPTANISGGDITVSVGTSVTFDGSSSSDLDGSIASYLWDNGDATATSARNFNTVGQFTVSLTVTDNEGASSNTASINVTVEEEPVGIQVSFTCTNGSTSPGTSVYVVGNIPELGNWSVASAAQVLETANYPTWQATFTNIPANTAIEWKCVKANEQTLAITQWQGGGNNQVTTGTSGTFSTQGGF